MSILIKGMEMPKNCLQCDCTDTEYGECVLDPGKRCPDDYKKRADWCPLVPVPPHGRLIDADALKETLDYYIREAGWSDEINEALTWVRDEFIDHEHTIIEAEEGE